VLGGVEESDGRSAPHIDRSRNVARREGPGYIPDNAARELGQQVYTTIFTRDELTSAAGLLPLALVGDDSVYGYEKTHLPDGAWPPTNWYAAWVSGIDVFDVERESCPIEMR
jgi:hypothetical protein